MLDCRFFKDLFFTGHIYSNKKKYFSLKKYYVYNIYILKKWAIWAIMSNCHDHNR